MSLCVSSCPLLTPIDDFSFRPFNLQVQLAMGTVGLTFGALSASTFGMNLVSGFESHPHAFYVVACQYSRPFFLSTPRVLLGRLG